MSDSFSTVTSVSWLSRLGSSIKGILFGLLIFVIAFPLLFWNEGRTVKRTRALNEGARIVVSTSPESLDNALEGKLVHLSGRASTDDILNDPLFEVSSSNAVRLERIVEMYQWEEKKETETRRRTGGSEETVTTYEYVKTWSADTINSDFFERRTGHENPETMPFRNETVLADTVNVGAYALSDSLKNKISGSVPVNLTRDDVQRISRYAGISAQASSEWVYLGYRGSSLSNPRVGDLRVRFSYVPVAEVSVMAGQQGNRLEPYATKNGNEINLLDMGNKTADEMIASAKQANQTLGWILRGVGFLLMMAGLSAIFAPLAVVGDVIPLVGNLIRMGTGAVAGVLALFFSLITIAIAWIFYRPVLGIGLIVVAVVVVAAAIMLGSNRAPRQAPAQRATA